MQNLTNTQKLNLNLKPTGNCKNCIRPMCVRIIMHNCRNLHDAAQNSYDNWFTAK